MNAISFEQLYEEDKAVSYGLFLLWANDVLDGLGVPSPAEINFESLKTFLNSLNNVRNQGFPANGGYDAASPFKKAAYIYVCLNQTNPFVGYLPVDYIHEGSAPPTSISSLLGFALVKSCLTGVTITKSSGKEIVLSHPISVSHHFMIDLLEASNGITLQTHFRTFSLLFEALVYEANPGVCYQKVF